MEGSMVKKRLYKNPITILISLLLITACVGCGDSKSTAFSECSMSVDSVTTIDTKSVGSVNYYLVLRISGFHDKTEIIELFDQQPQYNNCNENIIPPIVSDSIASDMEISSFMIDLKEKHFVIDYSDKPPQPNQAKTLNIKFN
jgi:hypothetical protein